MAVVFLFSQFSNKNRTNIRFCIDKNIYSIYNNHQGKTKRPLLKRCWSTIGQVYTYRAKSLPYIITQLYLIFKRYGRFCKNFHKNNYHIESAVSSNMMKHYLVYAFLVLGGRSLLSMVIIVIQF